MPNRNSNRITYKGNIDKLIHGEGESRTFNLEVLRPDIFPKDPTGDEHYNYDLFVKLLWCKWNPQIDYFQPSENYIACDSPRTPPLGLLKRATEVLGIDFTCEYEEPGCWFEWTFKSFIDDDGDIQTSDDLRDYMPTCDRCWEKNETVRYHEDEEEYVCTDCLSVTYYILYDLQTWRYMQTGINSESKSELLSDFVDYIAGAGDFDNTELPEDAIRWLKESYKTKPVDTIARYYKHKYANNPEELFNEYQYELKSSLDKFPEEE